MTNLLVSHHQSAPNKGKSIRQKAGTYAKEIVDKTFAGSSIQDFSAQLPKFEFTELAMGKTLGKGGFGTVEEVRAFEAGPMPKHGRTASMGSIPLPGRKTVGSKGNPAKPLSSRSITAGEEDSEFDDAEQESRRFISQHCLRENRDARYAVKFLSPDVVKDPQRYLQGILDMAIETRFLSYLEHPNIVKLRAIGKGDPFHDDYFIVMDRLYDTLQARILKWAGRNNRNTGLGRFIDRKGTKLAALYEERIVAAYDLSSAVAYLHENSIVYRDLKPENIGFDIVRCSLSLCSTFYAIQCRCARPLLPSSSLQFVPITHVCVLLLLVFCFVRSARRH